MKVRSFLTGVVFVFACSVIFMGIYSSTAAIEAEAINSSYNYSEYAGAERFIPVNAVASMFNVSVEPNWISGMQSSFWYLKKGRYGEEFVLVDIQNRTKTAAFNHTMLAGSLSYAANKPVDPAHLPFSEITIDREADAIEFSAYNKSWQFHMSDNQIVEIAQETDASPGEYPSQDGRFAAFVHDHNLWVRDRDSGESYQLTTDGSEDYAYAERSGTVSHPVTQARLNQTPQPFAVWSPDSRRIATFRMDQRNVDQLNLIQYAPDSSSRPKLWTYRFAMPGDRQVPMYEPIVVDVLNKTVIPVSSGSQPEVSLMDTEEDVLQWWSDDGRVLYSLHAELGEKALELQKTDPGTGRTETILEERGATYVEANLDYGSLPNAKVLKNGDVVWFSEKDGFGHLYLYGKDGLQKNAITSGNWVVRTLLRVDENESLVYFTGSGREAGRDPYYRHLYRAHLNGSALQLLTPEDADHSVQFDLDGTAVLDTYSRVDMPPATVVRNLNGSVIMNLENGDIGNLTDMGWRPPERFVVKALDGETDLYGLLIKPTDFDASLKYPIVETVYPGPWIIVTAKSFPADLAWVNKIFWRAQAVAELGFIVVTMDGPGTPFRSKEFHDASYGHLGDAGGLADHVNALKQLAEDRPYMDLGRVGMFGHSAGGFMTAQALLTYPDFYKVGVASSGDHDSRFYGAFWGQKYEGLKSSDYGEQITSLKAGNLTGKLLLATGDVDDNVHPCMTMQLVDALIRADRPFDLLIMTNRNHDLSYDPYYLHRLFGYLAENLKVRPVSSAG
ncbi:MAG TPA: DPP IV N-terminal domain-containing protein [Methanotrichaceae archaeon]|nr:DPP IV N-terminal domain-containing protein [Methanotrichaceae archaeon]HQF16774.1 DPP IV N-terminal domain-containing protein [Methanotrichaceae archaeon]HQI91406.1 DPP IV N-terminal domain-containing protein [Methanotrichaceae archaeon]HQJ28628.1 DPP IV N-terminal domain-containing protein [Methanotrichaceae archaeon]